MHVNGRIASAAHVTGITRLAVRYEMQPKSF